MRRVKRVADDAALRMAAIGLEAAHKQPRRTRRDDDHRIERGVEPGEQRAFQFLALGGAFLDEIGPGKRRLGLGME
jgi:hypothetical protein